MTTRDLLAEAYDAEQAGDLIGAIKLRALYHSQRQQQADQAAPVEPPVPIAPVTTSFVDLLGIDRTSRGARRGAAAGAFTGICRTVSDDRADRLMAWVEELYTQDAAYLNRFIDRLMLLVPAVPLSEQDDSGAGGLLAAAAYTLYKQGKRDGEQAMLRAITDAVIEGPPAPPAAPTLPHIAHMYDDDGQDFPWLEAGEGLTEVRVCPDGEDQPGVLLVIGGTAINEENDQIITLADLRQIRDNLSVILADPRLGGPLPPPPAIYTERLYHEDDEDGDLTEEPCGPLAYVDYCIGQGDAKVAISFDVNGRYAPDVDLGDRPSIKLDHFLAWLPNLLALLSSEQVQQARIRHEAGAPLMRKAERAAYEERQQFKRAA